MSSQENTEEKEKLLEASETTDEKDKERVFRSITSHADSFASALSANERIPQEVFRTTPIRWYILFAFCYMGLIQAFIGNSWGPIVEVMKKVYLWSDQRISSLALWTPVFFVPSAIFFPVLISMTSMRFVMLTNTSILATSGLVKILSVTVVPMQYLVYFAHITQIMNGLCGAVPYSAIMYISVNWFPVKEQLVVVGLIVACQSAGVAIPFVVGPNIVPEPPAAPNMTGHTLSTGHTLHSDLYSTEHPMKQFYDGRLRCYLILQGSCMIASLVLALLYFPSRPRYAPTATAVVTKLDIKEGVRILLRRPNFWMPVLTFSLTTGAINGYGLTLQEILESSELSQNTSNYIGFAALLCSVPANLIVGTLGAFFPKDRKIMTGGFLLVGTISMAIFVAQLEFWMTRSMAVIWSCVIIGVMCLTGCAPLLFDMSAEASHPVSEELSSSIMVLGNQITCLLYIALIQIVPTDAKDELNYVLIAAFVAGIIALLCYRVSDVRATITQHSITVDQLDYRSIQQVENAGFSVEASFRSVAGTSPRGQYFTAGT